MTAFAQQERRELCDLFTELGPDAPTLCEGWTTADLAAHLVVRERRPDAALGIVVSSLADRTDKVQRQVRDARPWPQLVDTVRSGPPLLLRPVDEPMNAAEYFVHVEDVRRAQAGWEPRPLDPALEKALFGRVKMVSRGLVKRSPVPVVLNCPGHGRLERGTGGDPVTVTGPPSEMLLFLFGRKDAARLEFAGSDEAVARLKAANLSM